MNIRSMNPVDVVPSSEARALDGDVPSQNCDPEYSRGHKSLRLESALSFCQIGGLVLTSPSGSRSSSPPDGSVAELRLLRTKDEYGATLLGAAT